jgi:hypothetical protein
VEAEGDFGIGEVEPTRRGDHFPLRPPGGRRPAGAEAGRADEVGAAVASAAETFPAWAVTPTAGGRPIYGEDCVHFDTRLETVTGRWPSAVGKAPECSFTQRRGGVRERARTV